MVHRGKVCVAHGPGGISCGSSQNTPGVSLHHFPNREKDSRRFRRWVRFVRRYRPKWTVCSNQTSLCGLHFEESCFSLRRDIARSLGMRIILNRTAVPTIHVLGRPPNDEKKSRLREKRKKKLTMKVCEETSSVRGEAIVQKSNASIHQPMKGCDLAVNELVAQHCKQGQISDENVVRNNSDCGENDKTWYPSECALEEWKQGRQKTSEANEEMTQGLSIDELFPRPCKQEPVSDEDIMQNGSDEENPENTWDPNVPVEQFFCSGPLKEEQISKDNFIRCSSSEENGDSNLYSSECVLGKWKESKEATSKSTIIAKQVLKKKQEHGKSLRPSADTLASSEELSLSTANCTDSAQSCVVVHKATRNEKPRRVKKRSHSESSITEMKKAKSLQETESRWKYQNREIQKVDVETQVVDADHLACNARSCNYCKLCFTKDFILQHEKKCRSKTLMKGYHQVEHVSKEQQTDCEELAYFCAMCEKEFDQVASFTQLKGLNIGKKQDGCGLCGKKFANVGSLALQTGVNPAEQHSICEICGQQFNDVSRLNEHKRIHIGERPYARDIYVKQVAQLKCLTRHKNAHTGEKRHICDICGKGFAFLGHLTEHKRIHTGEKPHICEICGKGFGRMASLRRHRRVHTGEKPYICGICGKGFADVGNLRSHSRTHTGERPCICNICGKRFAKSSNCSQHRQSHTHERPYTCDTCGKNFARLGHLTEHRRIHTGEKPYICEVCGKRFSRVGILNRHRHIHTREKSQNCDMLETIY